jgi:hypothetical protein
MRELIVIASICALLAACESTSTAPPTTAGAGAVTAPPAGAGGVAGKLASGAAGGSGKPVVAMVGASAPTGGAGSAADGGEDAGVAPMAGAGGSAQTPSGPATGPFPPVTDFKADGPFKPSMLQSTGPKNNYTVYFPAQLAPESAKNPIVGWMSGGGTTPSAYPLLPYLASHGFVVVASNTTPSIGDEGVCKDSNWKVQEKNLQ